MGSWSKRGLGQNTVSNFSCIQQCGIGSVQILGLRSDVLLIIPAYNEITPGSGLPSP